MFIGIIKKEQSLTLQRLYILKRHSYCNWARNALCGFHGTGEADAALLFSAAIAEAAMYRGEDTYLLLNGAHQLPLLEV